MPNDQCLSSTSVEDELREFRESLKSSSTTHVQTLSDSFNNSFRQNLALGLVPEDLLCKILRQVTETLEKSTTDEMLVAACCGSFYQATWDGIKACKVQRPVDLGSDALNRMLLLLGHFPSTQAVQNLAIDIIRTASPDQVAQMEDGILSVVKGWLWGWTTLGVINGRINTGTTTHDDFGDSVHLKESVKVLAKSLGGLPQIMAPSILYACTDHLVFTCFANFRGPMKTIRNLRYSWLSVVANMPCVDEKLLIAIWSRMDVPRVSSDNSKSYSPSIPPLTLHESCNLLLDFWISQGQIKAVKNVRAMYEASIQASGRSESAGYLLQALKKHDEPYCMKARCLFRFLRHLEKPKAVYSTFRSIRALNMQLPARFVAKEIGYMSRRYPRYALNIYRIYNDIRCNGTPILLYRCTDLFVSMIKSPEFNPGDIWAAFGVPIHKFDPRRDHRIIRRRGPGAEDIPEKQVVASVLAEIRPNESGNERSLVNLVRLHDRPSESKVSNPSRSSTGGEAVASEDPPSERLHCMPRPLPRAKVELVNKMALAFAQAGCRSPRVALRNVFYCVLYLRRHREPLSPELTRALTLAGITRDLLNKNWVGRRKALWILDMVNKVEGDMVGSMVAELVYNWRGEHIAQQQRLRR
jgi:hypothetical protein